MFYFGEFFSDDFFKPNTYFYRFTPNTTLFCIAVTLQSVTNILFCQKKPSQSGNPAKQQIARRIFISAKIAKAQVHRTMIIGIDRESGRHIKGNLTTLFQMTTCTREQWRTSAGWIPLSIGNRCRPNNTTR